jgi:hypothetical protein
MKELLDYTKGVVVNRYAFDEDQLLVTVHNLEGAINDYETAVNEYIQRQN